MIERHHYFKLKDAYSNDKGRAALAAAMRETLPGLPGVLAVTVGLPADEAAEVWDIALCVRFDSIEDLQVYRADPAHRKFADEVVAHQVEIKKIWNFRVDCASR